MSKPEGESREWGLVMPFVICRSNGGTYDDHAFVAGARYGEAHYKLRAESPDTWKDYVFPDAVAQYELLAMDQGYKMTAEPWDEHPDEWVLVTFNKDSGEERDEV